jgi:hypothetical protein
MPGLIIFDPESEVSGFTTGDTLALGTHNDIQSDTLFFTDGLNIYEWDESATQNLLATWRSAEIRLDYPVNLGAAMVEADTYFEAGSPNKEIIFRLYADGVLKFTKTVTSDEPFRLPGGYLSNIYAIEIETRLPITRISIAEDIFDLREG